MNNNQHITKDEWIRFYTSKQDAIEYKLLQRRIMLHIQTCSSCYALYQSGKALQRAGQQLSYSNAPARQDAYRAVASGGKNNRTKAAVQGILCVSIDNLLENAQFLEETIETSGIANQYALHAEDDGQRLVDDGDALHMVLRDNQVHIHMDALYLTCRYQLLSESGETAKGVLHADGTTIVSLIPNQFLTLEIVFAAPDYARN